VLVGFSYAAFTPLYPQNRLEILVRSGITLASSKFHERTSTDMELAIPDILAWLRCARAHDYIRSFVSSGARPLLSSIRSFARWDGEPVVYLAPAARGYFSQLLSMLGLERRHELENAAGRPYQKRGPAVRYAVV
jgi:hypothetical protein